MSIDLSIIIPCLNEEENVDGILDSVYSIAKNLEGSYEIVVIDDQSIDSTYTKINQWINNNPECNIKLIYKELYRRGYGATVKYGLAYSQGEYAIFVSADMVDPIHLIPQMYSVVKNGYDVAQVSRYLDKNNSITIPFSYKFFQFFFRGGVRIALGKYIPDSTYAFKMFNRSKVTAMGISSNRFNISPEIMFKSILAGHKIKYISGAQGTRANGVSKFKFHKEGIGFGICLVRAYLHRKNIIYWF